MDDQIGLRRLWWVGLLLISQFPTQARCYTIFWSAYVEVNYVIPETNQSKTSVCECGVYGSNSPLNAASGYVALPTSDALACDPNTTFAVRRKPWIALIKRGNCSHAVKIQAARQEGASAVVVYNIDGTGNKTNRMSHEGTGDIVAIMIGNHLGRQITNLVERNIEVYMSLLVGNPYKSWENPLWIYIMSFTFFGITAIILGYFFYVIVKRLYRNRQLRIQQRELKKVAERAIAKLQVRTLRRNDPEVEADENSCAVCIDSFKRGDIVTTLPCSHLFHKTCVEPWLLEHHTCPMCKYDILKGEVGVESSQESSRSPADVRFYPSSVSGSLAEPRDTLTSLHHTENRADSHVQTAEYHVYEEPHTRRKEHIYENPGFEGEQQVTGHQDTNGHMRQV
ncbi:RING finger protein 148 [Hoplias malabaricus]|uniref:RING finger protein 148 n=1 Tax=Hoplias malabaricus TaxID=27720 RepID=UPI003461A904